MDSRELLRKYSCLGIDKEKLRYARNNNLIVFKINRGYSRGHCVLSFEYEEEDVMEFINGYWLKRDKRWVPK